MFDETLYHAAVPPQSLRQPLSSASPSRSAQGLLDYARTHANSHCAIVSATLRECLHAYLHVKDAIPPDEVHSFSATRRIIALNNGTILHFFSAEALDPGRGLRMHYVSISPLVNLASDMYTTVIMPSVIGQQSFLITQGNPLDENPEMVREAQ